jgi:hypothetical protein
VVNIDEHKHSLKRDGIPHRRHEERTFVGRFHVFQWLAFTLVTQSRSGLPWDPVK